MKARSGKASPSGSKGPSRPEPAAAGLGLGSPRRLLGGGEVPVVSLGGRRGQYQLPPAPPRPAVLIELGLGFLEGGKLALALRLKDRGRSNGFMLHGTFHPQGDAGWP